MEAFGTTDFREDLTKVTVPTLVIHGDSDATVPFEGSGRRTHEAIAGSELVVVEDAPHGFNVSHALEFNRAAPALPRALDSGVGALARQLALRVGGAALAAHPELRCGVPVAVLLEEEAQSRVVGAVELELGTPHGDHDRRGQVLARREDAVVGQLVGEALDVVGRQVGAWVIQTVPCSRSCTAFSSRTGSSYTPQASQTGAWAHRRAGPADR